MLKNILPSIFATLLIAAAPSTTFAQERECLTKEIIYTEIVSEVGGLLVNFNTEAFQEFLLKFEAAGFDKAVFEGYYSMSFFYNTKNDVLMVLYDADGCVSYTAPISKETADFISTDVMGTPI